MYYFIVRKSNTTYYCDTFTASGFTPDWQESKFYEDEAIAQAKAEELAKNYDTAFVVEKC